ncbi:MULTISPECIES: LuxR C-terminal-related transcriptional regulator [unclassified Streptomyces]|uniref:LuxR C-terminal-related transcriptional regulator n=1 Tax=Streptomyces sp. cf386 TaxID=1761904 RepID=UPI00210EE12D|nr:LuxR C-terminal-related transcriptional regulator [Streptomyces sp. cf386]
MVYRHLLQRPSAGLAEALDDLGLPPECADHAVADLVELGLVHKGSEQSPVAVAPERAVERVLAPMERVLLSQRHRIEAMRDQLMDLAPIYSEWLTGERSDGSLEYLVTLDQALATITKLSTTAETEVLTAQPGGGRKADILEEAIGRDEAMLERGVRMRTLYQHTARFSHGTRAYVERVSRLGAEVRTMDDEFMRLLLFDRKTAVIGVQGDMNAAIVVREPNLVHFIASTFDIWWLTAARFPLDWRNDEVADVAEQLKRRIALLLSEGVSDQVIAKRMAMSVRTCRRHIAEIMERLGADSRFQAGYLLGVQRAAGTGPFTSPQ